MQEINTIIQLRNDTAENWATDAGKATPLMSGEVAVEIVDGKAKLKVGNGTDNFGDLDYFAPEAQVFQSGVVEYGSKESDNDIIASLVEGKTIVNGDCVIIKKETSANSEIYSYTSYVFNGTDWVAMDGNYSAANVILGDKITLAGNYEQIGNYTKGYTVEAGTTLQEMLMNMLSQRLQPSATNPSASVILTNNNNNGADVKVEVGSTFTPKYRTTFSSGSFTYGNTEGTTATGCTSTAATVSLNSASGISADIAANALNGVSGSLPSFVIPDTSDRKLTLTYGYTANTKTPADNLGTAATNDTKIDAASGKTVQSSHKVTGFRNYWYGFISTTDVDTITRDTSKNTVGDGVKTLIAGGAAISNKTLPTITAVAGDRMPVVVMPTSANKKVSSATMPGSLNAPVTFTKMGTVNIEGYNGYDAVSYDVWGYKADEMPVGADFSIVIG